MEVKFDFEAKISIQIPKSKFRLSWQRINSADEFDFNKLNKKLRNLKTHIENQYSSDFYLLSNKAIGVWTGFKVTDLLTLTKSNID